MVKLSVFADEISADLDEQIKFMKEEGIRFAELRGVWGKGVLKLDKTEISLLKGRLSQNNIRVSAIGSPIGKVGIESDFDEHLEDFRKSLDLAEDFGCKYVRVFSFYIPKGEDPGKYRDEVIGRMSAMTSLSAERGIVLANENEGGLYGDIPERCRDIVDSVGSPYLKVNFDPSNFIMVGRHPYRECFPILKDEIEYFHMKDGKFDPRAVTPVGEGDGEIDKILAEIIDYGYEGFLSLEPHLAGRLKVPGPEAFKIAAKALKKVLRDIGAEYE